MHSRHGGAVPGPGSCEPAWDLSNISHQVVKEHVQRVSPSASPASCSDTQVYTSMGRRKAKAPAQEPDTYIEADSEEAGQEAVQSQHQVPETALGKKLASAGEFD